MSERNSIKINSIKNTIFTRTLIEFLEKRRRLIIRSLKLLSKNGVKMFFIKSVSNGIIIFKTYYEAVNNPVYS